MLSTKNIAALGFMTFAMYLEAGNLIFPPFLGYQAGEDVLAVMFGFLLTGVGLPAFALIVVAVVGGSDKLTDLLPKPLATSFWVMVFIVIGPAFIIPRALTVAYQFSLEPFIGDAGLLPFSVVFCVASIAFSLYPGKLVDTLGKWLTPILLMLLAVLVGMAFINPVSDIGADEGTYAGNAVATGLTQGYMTIDALGSVGFGWIIYQTIRNMGVTKPALITRYTLYSAAIYAVAMSSVYISLAYIGATSSGLTDGTFSNGGEILTRFAQHQVGMPGTILLGIVIMLACLTTAIGVTTAGSQFYSKTFSKVNYNCSVCLTLVLSALVANIGLDQLLAITLPVVVAIHPIAISLLFVALARKYLNRGAALCIFSTAAGFGVLDAANILGSIPEQVSTILSRFLPLFSVYASWLLPTLVVLAFSVLMVKRTGGRISSESEPAKA